MTILLWAALLPLISMASVYLNALFLATLETSTSVRARVKFWHCVTLCIGSAILVGACNGVFVPRELEDVALSLFCVWATIIAYFDRQTTWVTDQSLLAMMAFGMIVSGHSRFLLDALEFHFLSAGSDLIIGAVSFLLAGAALILARQAHAFQVGRGRVLVTGADVIAAALPLLCFGISYSASLSYGMAALILLGLRISDRFAFFFRRPDAVSEGLLDIGRGEVPETDAVPAFMAFVPAVLLVLCVIPSSQT